MGTISISSNNESRTVSPTDDRSLYDQIFHAPKYKKSVIVAPILPFDKKQQNLIQVIDEKIVTNRKQAMMQCPKPTALPSVYIDASKVCKSIDLVQTIETMQIDDMEKEESNDINMNDSNDNGNKLKLQWKYRSFERDNRPPFFGVNPNERIHAVKKCIDIKKLCRNPISKMVENIDYNGEDSGEEWYDDIDDLEATEDDDDDDEDQGVNLRADGFENDKFLINSDDDDEDAMGDREAMKNMKKHKRLKDRLKGEYPVQYGNRERGDNFDETIVVQLPSMKCLMQQNDVLYALTIKKCHVFVQEMSHILHDDVKENDLEYLIANETKNEAKNDKNESKEKKKRKKEKKKMKKLKKKEKREREAMDKSKSEKMECDDDEDDDIKMTNDDDENKEKKKENRLTNYFMVATKRKRKEIECDDNHNHNQKDENESKEKKKNEEKTEEKKRRNGKVKETKS